jgi:hypothetical protein
LIEANGMTMTNLKCAPVRNAAGAGAWAFLVCFLSGCSGKAPPPPIVEAGGTVLLDGKPLYKAQVRFFPLIDYGAEYVATGVTDKAGRFTLTCKGQPGACAGKNLVLVMEAELPARVRGEERQAELAEYLQSLGGRPLPPAYANLASSPLSAEVKAGQKQYNFELKR